MPNYRNAFLALAMLAAFFLTGCGTTTHKPTTHAAAPTVTKQTDLLRENSFANLPGWDADNLREAWPAFLASCGVLGNKSGWSAPCSASRRIDATDVNAIRTFFEYHFVPHRLMNDDGSDSGLITGYYEPLLRGARKRGGPYQTPLYRKPDDLLTIDLSGAYPELNGMRLRGRFDGKKIVPYFSRAEITQSGKLAGKELMWVDDPVDAFFLQVQGSGRVQLAETREIVRVAYADQNGHPYKSIGRYLVDQGEIALDQASAQSIKSWFSANPARQQELLNANPGFVFFKEEAIKNPQLGPKGALGVPLTARRSIAVDPSLVPLGAPVFIATSQPFSNIPLQSLVLAQDTGSAIKGSIRADYFWGYGVEAEEQAGKMKQRLRMWVLLPKYVRH